MKFFKMYRIKSNISKKFSTLMAISLLIGLLLPTSCKTSKNITTEKKEGHLDVYFSNYKITYFGDYDFTQKVRNLFPPYDGTAMRPVLRGTKVLGLGTTKIPPHFSTFIVINRKSDWQSKTEIENALQERGVKSLDIAEIEDNRLIATYKVWSDRFNLNMHVSELIIPGEKTVRVLIWTYNSERNLVGESRDIFKSIERVYQVIDN